MAQKEGGNRPLATAEEHIARSILVIRGQRVIMDSDLAILYGVQGKALLQAVRRNKDRFPLDFMFQLDKQELARLRSQSVTSKERGGRRYAPFAFAQDLNSAVSPFPDMVVLQRVGAARYSAAARASLTARFPGGVSSPTMPSEKFPELQGIFAVWPRAEKGELAHGCHHT